MATMDAVAGGRSFVMGAASGDRQLLAARILLASLFLFTGLRLMMNWTATLGFFTKLGMPLPELVLPLVVLLQIGGGVLLILNWNLHWVAGALAVFTVASAVIGHAFWGAEPAQYVNHLNHFLKNIAICGGLIAVAINRR
jgi:putative oxidoreductase